MKNKDIIKLFQEENSQIDIKQSEVLKNTQIVKSSVENGNHVVQGQSLAIKSKPMWIFSIMAVFVGLIAALLIIFVGGSKGSYTSFVLEINPQIAITVDKNDYVVSVIALNEDADLVLEDEYFNDIEQGQIVINDCLDKIVSFIYDENPDKFSLDGEIKIYATNDNEEVARNKLAEVKVHIANKLDKLGQRDVLINDDYITPKDFGGKIGVDDLHGLDDKIDEIKGKDKFFRPNGNPQPPSDKPIAPDDEGDMPVGDRPIEPDDEGDMPVGDRPIEPDDEGDMPVGDRPIEPDDEGDMPVGDRPVAPDDEGDMPVGDRPIEPDDKGDMPVGDRPVAPDDEEDMPVGDRPVAPNNDREGDISE